MQNAPFKFHERKKFYSVQLKQSIEPKEFEALAATALKTPKHVLVSCAGIKDLNNEWVKSLDFLQQQLKLFQCQLHLVFVGKELQAKLKSIKKTDTLKITQNLNKFKEDLEQEDENAFKMHFIKSFVNATQRTFYIHAKTRCDRGPLEVRTKNLEEILGEISGLIQVKSFRFSYFLALSFPETTYLALMAKMLDQPLESLTPELLAGATELLNIIYGQAKKMLNEKRAKLQTKTPELIQGKTIAIKKDKDLQKILKEGKEIIVPFQSEFGQFYIQIFFPKEFNAKMLRA